MIVDGAGESKALIEERRRFRAGSMDRSLNKQTLDSIRHTMRTQEDIFMHQVREMHRVYSVQKMMMEELRNKESKQRQHWSRHHHHHHGHLVNPTPSRPTAFALHNANNRSSGERSESCSGIDLESPAKGISAVDDNGRVDRRNGRIQIEESELELTLSIGVSSSSTSRSHSQREVVGTINNGDMDSSTTSYRSEDCNNNNNNNNNNQKDCSGPSTPMSSSSTTLDQEKKRPHWLLQGLSIHRS